MADDTVIEFQGVWKIRGKNAKEALAAALAELPVAHPAMTISELITIASETDAPLVVKDDGRIVGVIDKARLLRGIQGEIRP